MKANNILVCVSTVNGYLKTLSTHSSVGKPVPVGTGNQAGLFDNVPPTGGEFTQLAFPVTLRRRTRIEVVLWSAVKDK